MLLAIITLLSALSISSVAIYFSVIGMSEIFAAAVFPIMIMMLALEIGKIVAAIWLHSNWKNPGVSFLHKGYLIAGILVLMLLTSTGIYGFLAAAHLNQEAPSIPITNQIQSIDSQINSNYEQIKRAQTELDQLNSQIDVLLKNDRATQSTKIRDAQKKERQDISENIKQLTSDNDNLIKKKFELKENLETNQVKLGPIKYIADLFGINSSNLDQAVRIVILMLIFSFDPLAIILVISAVISFKNASIEKKEFEPKKIIQKEIPKKINSPKLEINGFIQEIEKFHQLPEINETEIQTPKEESLDLPKIEPIFNTNDSIGEPAAIEMEPNIALNDQLGLIEKFYTNDSIDSPVHASYDNQIDTLYLITKNGIAHKVDQTDDGLILKTNLAGHPTSIAVPYYSVLWKTKQIKLINKSSFFLNIDKNIVASVLSSYTFNFDLKKTKEFEMKAKVYLEYLEKQK